MAEGVVELPQGGMPVVSPDIGVQELNVAPPVLRGEAAIAGEKNGGFVLPIDKKAEKDAKFRGELGKLTVVEMVRKKLKQQREQGGPVQLDVAAIQRQIDEFFERKDREQMEEDEGMKTNENLPDEKEKADYVAIGQQLKEEYGREQKGEEAVMTEKRKTGEDDEALRKIAEEAEMREAEQAIEEEAVEDNLGEGGVPAGTDGGHDEKHGVLYKTVFPVLSTLAKNRGVRLLMISGSALLTQACATNLPSDAINITTNTVRRTLDTTSHYSGRAQHEDTDAMARTEHERAEAKARGKQIMADQQRDLNNLTIENNRALKAAEIESKRTNRPLSEFYKKEEWEARREHLLNDYNARLGNFINEVDSRNEHNAIEEARRQMHRQIDQSNEMGRIGSDAVGDAIGAAGRALDQQLQKLFKK